MPEVTIRGLMKEDCHEAAELIARCMRERWAETAIEGRLRLEYDRSLTAWDGERLVGVVIADELLGEVNISVVAVDEGHRRMGVARRMLGTLLDSCRPERAVLEVRASNEPAIRLYETMGFESVGRRPGFYEEPAEDALMMVMEAKGGKG